MASIVHFLDRFWCLLCLNGRNYLYNIFLESPFIHVDETKISIQGINQYVWVLTDGMHVIFQLSSTTALSEKTFMSRCQFEQLPSEGGDFFAPAPRQCRSEEYSRSEDRALQGFATIGVRRASGRDRPTAKHGDRRFWPWARSRPTVPPACASRGSDDKRRSSPRGSESCCFRPPDFLDVVEDLFEWPTGRRTLPRSPARSFADRSRRRTRSRRIPERSPRGSCRQAGR